MNSLKSLTLKVNYEEIEKEQQEQHAMASSLLTQLSAYDAYSFGNSLKALYLGEKGIYTAFANINNRLQNKQCLYQNTYEQELAGVLAVHGNQPERPLPTLTHETQEDAFSSKQALEHRQGAQPPQSTAQMSQALSEMRRSPKRNASIALRKAGAEQPRAG